MVHLSKGVKVIVAISFSIGVVASAHLTREAYAECSKPNDDTVFCIDTGDIESAYELMSSCSEAQSASGCSSFGTAQRNQFPDGSETADAGATKEEEADCYQTTSCVADPDNHTCKAGTANSWRKGDKTVNNPSVTCPPAV
jgi:hypothetical protein